MEYNDFAVLMKKQKLKYKDILGKIPDSRGGFYKTKNGLWRAMNISPNKKENCEKIINFFLNNLSTLDNKK